jgi:single-stranded DNA-binding protein
MAEACNQYLEKGKLVAVVGRVSAQAWKDKNGEARAGLEVIASSVKFLSPHEGNTVTTSDPSAEMPDEDVPF